MPTFEFHQGREPGSTSPDPTHWDLQALFVQGELDEPVVIEQIGPPVYFDCEDPVAVRQTCHETLVPSWRLGGGEGSPAEVQSCVDENLTECVAIDTVPLDPSSDWVQVRACRGDLSCSQWSQPIVVPQAPFLALLVAGCVLIKGLKGLKGPR